jgi:hypothetical protein
MPLNPPPPAAAPSGRPAARGHVRHRGHLLPESGDAERRASAKRCPGCCAPWSRPALCRSSRAPHGSPIPTDFGRWRPVKCHDPDLPASPPREGVRPRPRRSAGPQRQGANSGLREGLGRPPQAARPTRGPRSPASSWRFWRRCYGASTTAGTAAASRATRQSPRKRSAPAAAGRFSPSKAGRAARFARIPPSCEQLCRTPQGVPALISSPSRRPASQSIQPG